MASPPRLPSRRTLAPQAPPRGLYLSTYDPTLGAAICRRVAAGESLRGVCDRDPAMPTGKTVWNWRRAHPEFALMLEHAQDVARARALTAQAEADTARRRARAAARTAPGRTGRPSSFDEGAWGLIMARLLGGEGLAAICRDADLPSAGTVYNWMRAAPALVEDYRTARAFTAEIMVEQACEGLPWIGERQSWPMLRRVVRAAEKQAARLKLKRYAEPRAPEGLTVTVESPDGSRRGRGGRGLGWRRSQFPDH